MIILKRRQGRIDIKPVKNIYKNVRSFGIDAVELDYERAVKEEASLFKNLKEADFSVSCMYGFFDFAHGSTVEDGRRMVDFAEKHDIRRIMLIPWFLEESRVYPLSLSEKIR